VAVPRKSNPKLVMRTKKIFVGGLSATTSLEDIKAYFQQFSTVKESMLAYDKVGLPGYGTVTLYWYNLPVDFYMFGSVSDPNSLIPDPDRAV
jgi:hypothetical protein